MSTKTVSQQPRRAPLSLTGSGKQHNQNQYSGKSADSNGNSNNSASAKNDNKLSASQKAEQTNNDARESTPKDVKKSQNAEKKQSQQQQPVNIETAKKTDKVEEKKTQNGAGKAATNGGAKERQQNGSEKQENGNGNASNAKSANSNSNGNITSKSTTKPNEKSTAPTKEEAKSKEQKLVQNNEKNDKESEKDKKKENAPEKTVEKETRSRRHDIAVGEAEKKQTEKTESIKSDDRKTEVSTPTPRSSAAQSKTSTTPTRGVDKSSGASTPTRAVEKLGASQRTKTVTTVIDDVEMEPLAVDPSPIKPQKNSASAAATTAVAPVTQPPAATSTPGKGQQVTQKTKLQAATAKSEMTIKIQTTGSSPDRNSAPRTFTQIAGRRSIRPLTEYTPSKFQGNLQFRESYRRINTELDVSSTTNTSMNVTVGSEVPNSSSFSFFGRGRKRDRTPPPQSQSTMELQTDADYSPPKRARLDMQTFFNVVSSPITMLRSRFSRASIQSSTPMKLTSKLTANDEAEVQNVSGISIEEEINEGGEEKTATEDVTVGKKSDGDATSKMDSPMKVDEKCSVEKGEEKNSEGEIKKKSSDLHEIAAGVADTSVTSAKNKRCNVM